jgi:hypothetical protein
LVLTVVVSQPSDCMYCTILNNIYIYTVLSCVRLYRFVFVLYCIVLYCIVLYCFCIVLYCYVCQFQIYLKDLTLDEHARKKMIELAGYRYNEENDELTIAADRYSI